MNTAQPAKIALIARYLGIFMISVMSLALDRGSAGVILFLGDSITAGYGLDVSQAYPDLIQKKIESNRWNFKIVNAGQSGDTTAGGLARLDWLLKNKIDILVLELGANDGLRGFAVPQIKKNLQAIIDRTRVRYPNAKIIIAGMKVPPNFGGEYGRQFEAIFPELAKKNDAALIPFILQGVGGIRELNLADGIHPTAKGQQIVADNVWRVLQPELQSLARKTGSTGVSNS
jgi:acyl-CoA thioesterase-1